MRPPPHAPASRPPIDDDPRACPERSAWHTEHPVPVEPELRTPRLLLRRWRDTDRPPFAALNADPLVMEHFPAPLRPEESDDLVDRIEAGFEERGWGLWAVEVPGTTAFAGFVGLNPATFDAPFTPAVEVGWRLAREHWGRGYATEGARAALALVAAAGGAVQGSIGFGQNLVLVPIVALVVPEAVPGALVALGIPLTGIMAAREWHGVDWPGLGWIVLGRVPGTVVGVLIVALVSGNLLSTLAGSAVLAGVLLSVLAGHVPVNRETATSAGATAGVLGTTAAIDGPPLALLYQRHPGPTIRATLACAFLIGAIMSFTALASAGEVPGL